MKISAKFNKLKKIISVLEKNSFEAVVVGGAVRDHLMGKIPQDFDIATNARPEVVEKLFSHTIGIGKQFGVILVVMGGEQFEVATYRKDIGYSDGRRPDKVEFADARADVLRRDFTINGLFWHPVTNEIVDYIDGQKDIKRKIIRSIGDPDLRFDEDKLRVLRAIRFAANLDFEIEKYTFEAIKSRKYLLDTVSNERIRVEYEKILTGSNPFKGISLIKEANLDEFIFSPDFFPQESNLSERVEKLFSGQYNLSLIMAISLFHASSSYIFEFKDGKIAVCKGLSKRLKVFSLYLKKMTFPNRVVKESVEVLSILTSFISNDNPDKAFIRRRLGKNPGMIARDILIIISSTLSLDLRIIKKLEEVVVLYKNKDLLPGSLICGKDLFVLGFESGPLFSKILEDAYNRQLQDDSLTKEDILQSIKEYE